MRTIPPFKLVPQPMVNYSRPVSFSREDRNAFNTRHQLGGHPEFIESDPDIPTCRFGKPMTFYAQLDSINEEFMLADRGMIYVFVCLNCFEVKAVMQSC